ncbi:uncharacterized protein LOC113361826 [Papaver somniferum]|uniref:uncharacterized protein LOC113361826 n=1 Tax=Papaver somniferum TaxID=3469 RepID=UPI000E6F8950|nr:uncharacterized protein LOC113361826 [Papaver somniferum]
MVREKLGNPPKFSCSCVDCKNLAEPLPPCTVHLHLLKRGMDPTYTECVLHGEKDNSSNDVHEEGARRTFYQMWTEDNVEGYSPIDPGQDIMQDEGLAKQITEADFPLYPGCTTHTKLSITIELYRQKTVNGVSRKAFHKPLKTTGSMLPPGHCLPKSIYEVKKLLKDFKLTYEKIHACQNDCCLFRKELKDADECPKCHYSRWNEDTSNMEDDDMIDKPEKKIPVKVLRYFSIVPRLKRLYKPADLAQQLIWHGMHKSKDGKIRHPSDSLAWQHIDTKFPEFASESRNLRLGLAADGFNPFGDISPSHSCCPVLIVVYNIPPQQCMQAENIILSLMIPGKKQPGRDIDIYLQPLIDDLIELWDNDVEVYDKFGNTMFNLKALLMWTINDFPAYGNISGCTYKGKATFPLCGDNTLSTWLLFSHKTVYMNHRRFLPYNHHLRSSKKKATFNGESERNEKPPIISGVVAFERQSSIVNDFGKAKQNECGKRKREVSTDAGSSAAATSGAQDADHPIFNKQSISFDLPYWKELLLRHNIDVMHTEKNVCESVIGTILNIKFKTKAGLNSRNDMNNMGIREDLHPRLKKGKTWLPPAPYNLSDKGKAIFYNRMRNLKVPSGYSSDLRRRFSKDGCLGVLKAHDYHVLMQQILPVALKGILPDGQVLRMHMDELRSSDTASDENQLLSIHSETFADWIQQKFKMQISQRLSVSNTVEWLAYGPLDNCVSYKGLEINGSRFITKDIQRVKQNSGVSIESKSLVAGQSQISGFYGVLEQIIVLDYQHMFQIPIFKCDWAHTYFGVKIEKGFTLVNLRQHKNQYQNDPFILASQA